MKTFKKLFAFSAIFALLATMLPTYAFAATYAEELSEAHAYALDKGITNKSSIETADMYGNLTRVAMAKMMANYVLDLGLQELDTTKTCAFTDVSEALDADYENGVTKACQLGLMQGPGGKDIFNPNGIVTRAEFGTVLSRALYGDEFNNEDGVWYQKHLNKLNTTTPPIMKDISNPNAKEARGNVMLMMMRSDPAANLNVGGCSAEEILLCMLEDDVNNCIAACSGTEEEVVLPGFATASRVGSVATHNIAQNAVAKKVGTIKLTAGENDTTVSSVVITRSGLGVLDDIDGIWLSRNGIDATSVRKPASSSQAATLNFVPALVMKAGSSMEFDVLVTLVANSQNSQHSFAVTAVNVNNGTSAGTPFDLSSINTTSYTVKNVATSISADQTIKAGETNKLISSVNLIPAITSTIKGFTITRESGEDFNKVLANIKAYYNSQEVGTVTFTNEKIVVSGLDIERMNQESATIELKADGIYVGSGATIKYGIEKNGVIAYEKNTNERMTMNTAVTNKTLNIDGVDMTLTNKLTTSKTVSPGTSSVELYKAELTANSEVEVTSYTFEFVTGSGDVNGVFIDNEVIAYVNGLEYYLTGAGKTFSASSERFSVDKNSPATIRVVGHVKSDASLNKSFKLNFKVNTVKNISDNVSFNPTGVAVESATTTINKGSFTLTRPSNVPSNKTVLEGSATDMMYFNLRASAENQVLKQVVVKTDVVTGNATTGFDVYATRLDLMQGTTVLKSVSTNLNSGLVVFKDFSKTLTKDETTPFTVRVQLKGGEAENLGLSVKHTILTGRLDIVRSADTNISTTTTNSDLNSDVYQVASNVPAVTLPTKVNNETTLAIANTSNYDVIITSVKFDLTRNIINNQFANWGTTAGSATGYLKEGNVVIGSGMAPGTITVATDMLVGTDTVERIIELIDSQNTVTADLYSVKISELKFKYVDRNDNTKVSTEITETYNVLK